MVIIFLLVSFMFDIMLSTAQSSSGPWFKDWPTLDRRTLKETKLRVSLKHDKGMGCKIPILKDLDLFDEELTQFSKETKPIVCNSQDWVVCHYSECGVVTEILETTVGIMCTYRDLLYVSSNEYVYGAPVTLYNTQRYVLRRSDHVKINCSGLQLESLSLGRGKVRDVSFFFQNIVNLKPIQWTGISLGFRKYYVDMILPSSEDKYPIDVLIFGFESLSKNRLIREMPQTHQYITRELKMTFLEGYNTVGDGTAAVLFPLLSGQTEFEVLYPRAKNTTNNIDAWYNIVGDGTTAALFPLQSGQTGFDVPDPSTKNKIDAKNFIFDRVKKHGYRTAYFEDVGTFQSDYNGFNQQPADHYLRAFFKAVVDTSHQEFCVGGTPRYRILINATEQFLNLPNRKRFISTFVGDISYDNVNMTLKADEATVEFLKSFKKNRRTKNTLLLFMGGRGSRSAPLRKTFQGYLEERLPLMAILLPEDLLKVRPEAQDNLKSNSKVWTTPHDIHATILDAMGLTKYIPEYKIPGANLPRAMSLLRPIPINRSCSEAFIEHDWCACVTWIPIFPGDPMHGRVARALFNYINRLTEQVRPHCVLRTLKSVSWVRKQHIKHAPSMKPLIENYQVRLTVGPGIAVFEGTVGYQTEKQKLLVKSRHISRINHQKRPTGLNGYRIEPDCLRYTHPHLTMFCYCTNKPPRQSTVSELSDVSVPAPHLSFRASQTD